MSQPYDFFAARPAPTAPSPFGSIPPAVGPAPVSAPSPTPFPAPYAAPYAAPPATTGRASSCPGTVVGAAVLAFVQAGVLALGAAGALYLATRVDSAFAELGVDTGGGLGGAVAFVAVLLLGLAGLIGLAAVQLLRARLWAAILLGVLEGVALLDGLWGIARDGAGFGDWLGLGFVAGIVVLLVLPESRAWLAPRR